MKRADIPECYLKLYINIYRMTKWDYIKTFKQERVTFREIVEYNLQSFKMQLNDMRTMYNIKHKLADIIHCFYPYEPINEIFEKVGVYFSEYVNTVQIALSIYQKYMNDVWFRDKLVAESRIKKLKRLV